jgi:hypothetical protein
VHPGKSTAARYPLGYAVERGHLASNLVGRIPWTTPAVAAAVDRRVVVSPAQAGSLLAAVRGLSDRGSTCVLRRPATLRGRHAPGDRPAPVRQGDGGGSPPPPAPGGAGPATHRPPGTLPEAPRRAARKHQIPFGPFMIAGAFLVILAAA